MKIVAMTIVRQVAYDTPIVAVDFGLKPQYFLNDFIILSNKVSCEHDFTIFFNRKMALAH